MLCVCLWTCICGSMCTYMQTSEQNVKCFLWLSAFLFSGQLLFSELGSRTTARCLSGPPVSQTHSSEGWAGTQPHPALSIGARNSSSNPHTRLWRALNPLNYLSSPYIDHFMVCVRRHQDGSVGKVWQLETSPREPQMGWENRLLQTVFSPSSGFYGICAYTHMQINVV